MSEIRSSQSQGAGEAFAHTDTHRNTSASSPAHLRHICGIKDALARHSVEAGCSCSGQIRYPDGDEDDVCLCDVAEMIKISFPLIKLISEYETKTPVQFSKDSPNMPGNEI